MPLPRARRQGFAAASARSEASDASPLRAAARRHLPRLAGALAALDGGGGDATALIRAAALFWLDWNGLADAAAHATHRLEDLDPVAYLAALGVVRNATADVLAAPNVTRVPPFAWGELRDAVGPGLAGELRARAEAFGYRYSPLRVGGGRRVFPPPPSSPYL